MKRNIINVVVTLFFLLTLGAETGQAQTSTNQFKSYIPFQFNIGEHKLPAGEYRIERRSEEHTSELQSQSNLVCRLLLEKKTHAVMLPQTPPRYEASRPIPVPYQPMANP